MQRIQITQLSSGNAISRSNFFNTNPSFSKLCKKSHGKRSSSAVPPDPVGAKNALMRSLQFEASPQTTRKRPRHIQGKPCHIQGKPSQYSEQALQFSVSGCPGCTVQLFLRKSKILEVSVSVGIRVRVMSYCCHMTLA